MRRPEADALGLIPAFGTKDLETRVAKPLVGGRAVERKKLLLARKAPGVRARRIGLITPEEADLLVPIHGECDVFTDQANSCAPMARTFGLGRTHDRPLSRAGRYYLFNCQRPSTDMRLSSRGIFCPSFAPRCPSKNQRAQGRPDAGCTRGLVCSEESTRVRNHRFNRSDRPSLRNGVNGVVRAL